MSWQAYVDNQLLGTGRISQAAIYGHNGSLWATSPGFSLSPEEIKTLVDAFDNAEKIQSNGIYANGVKYFALNHDEKNIHGKKGLDGVVAEKTAQAVIIGVYKEGTVAGQANKVVGDLGDYLRGLNYVSINL
ncbi:Profilin/allergen [Rhizophagus irregularis]|uniref:Profilin n=1 Tax=Rhizophagus irregularis TaxID=588596 RepID=A0A2N1NDN1_9GLOM|nr:Profilin/allergen [Rhizophagus irregularis]